ncbi:auxin-induced protein X15-like [Coffea eugenioides]|uniref:auxin-induced protein X15-like n=1 Tax=Coffea eugenioides TaxID=49369 RepID=UPI000F6095B9|nr:auxin-induced protein X15-like [Coffea eugenioides]
MASVDGDKQDEEEKVKNEKAVKCLKYPCLVAQLVDKMPKQVEIEGRETAPKGHFVVYVGSEMTRFVLPTSFLKNPLFQQLLDKAAEEFGFDNRSRIVLPCDVSKFQRLVAFLAKR